MADPSPVPAAPAEATTEKVPAGSRLPPWDVGDLPPPPRIGWNPLLLIGPGLLMVGGAIGGGEWLMGPAATAKYGGAIMGLATLSILCQVVYNLEVMRYTIYCGEPVFIGFFRLRPSPWFWTFFYIFIDFFAIWPYLSASAAVPLHAAFLGRMPTSDEGGTTQVIGYGVFLAAFVPLIFGGKVYNMVEKLMTVKVVLVLGYLVFLGVFFVSPGTWAEVFAGFAFFGKGQNQWAFKVSGPDKQHFEATVKLSTEEEFIEGTNKKVMRGTVSYDGKTTLIRDGSFEKGAIEFKVRYEREAWQSEVLYRGRAAGDSLIGTEQNLETGAHSTWKAQPHGKWGFHAPEPPLGDPLDWALLAGFAAIAGIGGLNNTSFSTYSRDKGWGMGAKVGAIPSMVGGVGISLSHTGRVFRVTGEALRRWFGWMKFIRRDQLAIWMVGSFLGMAIPSLLSLEYLRGVSVPNNEVPAATAQAITQQHPDLQILWLLTLLCGFIVLAPTQITAMDGLIRRWTDVLWTASPYTRHMKGHQVKYIYYALLGAYLLFGMYVLWQLPDPLAMTKVSGVLMNFGLGFSAFHTMVVNRKLLPPELRPGWLRCAGLIACGLFFIGISVLGFNRGMEDVGIYPKFRDWGWME